MTIRKILSAAAATSCLLLLGAPQAVSAQPAVAPAPTRLVVTPSITLGEARAIVDGALAFARERNMLMAVTVIDTSGDVVASAKMDGAGGTEVRFALGKAFASLKLQQTTEVLGAVQKTRPDRYLGIMNMYPGQVYLVGGGEPLAVNGKLVGAVGVAGLPQGVDEMAGRAGMAAWEKYRASAH